MPWFADAVGASGRFVRRRAVPTLGWLLLLAGVVYLIGGWLRADDVPDRTVMTVREGWIVLRPTWLYAALLLAVLVALLTVFGVDLARKHASRAAWREEVHAQVDTLRRELSLSSRAAAQGANRTAGERRRQGGPAPPAHRLGGGRPPRALPLLGGADGGP